MVSADQINTFWAAHTETFWTTFELLFLFSGFPEEQVTQIMEHIEKLIMTRLHKWVFCHDSCDDEQKDLALQRRIRYTFNTNHLCCCLMKISKDCLTADAFTLQLLKLGYSTDVKCSFSWWRDRSHKRPLSACYNRWFITSAFMGIVAHFGKCAKLLSFSVLTLLADNFVLCWRWYFHLTLHQKANDCIYQDVELFL